MFVSIFEYGSGIGSAHIYVIYLIIKVNNCGSLNIIGPRKLIEAGNIRSLAFLESVWPC